MNEFMARLDVARKTLYMRRALELAANGRAYASPNPMVGAVIVAPDGRVIGEGWHRKCGLGHAEVNAVASVAESDRELLQRSSMFVTLEPCSHYGKTPPCARMLVDVGIPHVVVAMTDPNPKVAGRGIAILREAGVAVEVGVLEAEARRLNQKFLTAMEMGRPFITLKWARSADGFMDWRRGADHTCACRFSTPLTTITTMRLRALHDAILTTSATVCADNPRLSLRGYDGHRPVPVILVGNTPLAIDAALLNDAGGVSPIVYQRDRFANLGDMLADMYFTHGFISLLVEAGPTMLNAMIEARLWDVAREEVAPFSLGSDGVKPAPVLPARMIADEQVFEDTSGQTNILRWYAH